MLERERIIGSLAEGDALITMDYSQKFLPAWHVESQKLYYGKKGLSWHVSHVLANISGTFVEHNFVHLLNHDMQVRFAFVTLIKWILQDSTHIIAIVRHMLDELSYEGVKRVHVRSDNAGTNFFFLMNVN